MSNSCFFVSDLHGHIGRYESLFAKIEEERPAGVFIGGDILPSHLLALSADSNRFKDFLEEFFLPRLERLRQRVGISYPEIFLILGNDDCRSEEPAIRDAAQRGLLNYVHDSAAPFGPYTVYGYAHVPPTPFLLKDWERYDVSRYVEPGCLHPNEGRFTVSVPESELKYGTIAADLVRLTAGRDLSRAIFLFHAPPYDTALDRCALDGKMIDHAPLDCHVGSIAIRRMIEERQPLVTLHGHVHESARLTGLWKATLGTTTMLSAAHDGPELALVRFDAEHIENACRNLY